MVERAHQAAIGVDARGPESLDEKRRQHLELVHPATLRST